MSPRDADHATGSTLATLAASLFPLAGVLVWTSVFAAGIALLFAGVLLLAAGWFYGLAERGDRDRHETGPRDSATPTRPCHTRGGSIRPLVLALLLALGGGWFWRTDKHEAGRARGPWRRYPHALDRAARLRDSDAPVSHARRIDQATRGAR